LRGDSFHICIFTLANVKKNNRKNKGVSIKKMLARHKQDGFTLIELVIVIIIVGVLAASAVTKFFSLIEFSRSQEAVINILHIRHSLERCYHFAGDYNAIR